MKSYNLTLNFDDYSQEELNAIVGELLGHEENIKIEGHKVIIGDLDVAFRFKLNAGNAVV